MVCKIYLFDQIRAFWKQRSEHPAKLCGIFIQIWKIHHSDQKQSDRAHSMQSRRPLCRRRKASIPPDWSRAHSLEGTMPVGVLAPHLSTEGLCVSPHMPGLASPGTHSFPDGSGGLGCVRSRHLAPVPKEVYFICERVTEVLNVPPSWHTKMWAPQN